MSEKVNVLLLQGIEGKALYVNDYRVAGPKPWGGGTTITEFNVDRSALAKAMERKRVNA